MLALAKFSIRLIVCHKEMECPDYGSVSDEVNSDDQALASVIGQPARPSSPPCRPPLSGELHFPVDGQHASDKEAVDDQNDNMLVYL